MAVAEGSCLEQIGCTESVHLPDGSLLRPAGIQDASAICALVNHYAAMGLMLPKPLNQVLQYIRDFVVVERDGELQACGAMHILWSDLGEIRSLAVREERRGTGIGRQIVEALLRQAGELGLPQVFALTYQRRFFERLGFRFVDRGDLPRKIWVDCVDCLKFPDCDEEGVIINLAPGAAHPRSDGLRKAVVGDVDEMIGIINEHAAHGRMLPRSRNHVFQNLRDFAVIVEDGHVRACGALHVLWDDLGEVRAVAVAPDLLRHGYGTAVMQALIEEGRRLGLPRLFAFTYERGFYEHLGFRVVPKESLPRKVWGECLDCPRFPNCDELAMVLETK
jgi:amino-acid N-acetyltransferase